MNNPKIIEEAKNKVHEIIDNNDDILYSKYDEYFKTINLPILEFRIISNGYYCQNNLIGLEIITSYKNIKYSISITKKIL